MVLYKSNRESEQYWVKGGKDRSPGLVFLYPVQHVVRMKVDI